MEMYQIAYKRYIKNCEKHGIERIIDFKQFIDYLTKEQIEMMLSEVH